MQVNVRDRDGVVHSIDAGGAETLMVAIRDAGLPIAAECGGCCACATCHVYVDADWLQRLPPADDTETVMLELAMEPRENSRLSCQIRMERMLDGLQVALAPGSET